MLQVSSEWMLPTQSAAETVYIGGQLLGLFQSNLFRPPTCFG
jgi:hypothetical protein